MDVTRSGTRSPQGEDVATEGEGAEENDDQCAKDEEEATTAIPFTGLIDASCKFTV